MKRSLPLGSPANRQEYLACEGSYFRGVANNLHRSSGTDKEPCEAIPEDALEQMPGFNGFLESSGLWDGFVATCPLQYMRPNAPSRVDIRGTLLMNVPAGRWRPVAIRDGATYVDDVYVNWSGIRLFRCLPKHLNDRMELHLLKYC